MRTLRIVLALVLALPVVACGDDDGGQTGNNNYNSHLFFDAATQQDGNVNPQPDANVNPQPDANVNPGSGVTGEACSAPAQCGGITSGTPECLTNIDLMGIYSITFPGGYCSSSTCTPNSACDNGNGTCVSLMIANYCLQTCTSAAECRTGEGYDCTTLPYIGGNQTYCLPAGGLPSFDGGLPGFGDGGLPFP